MGFFKRIFNTNGLKRTLKRATNLNGLKRNLGKISTVVGTALAATGIGAPLGAAIATAGNALSSVVNTVGGALKSSGEDAIKNAQATVNAGNAVQNTTAEGYQANIIKPIATLGIIGAVGYMLLGNKSKSKTSYRRRF